MYASPEQRVGGGGCLNLPKAVALELGLEEDRLTGVWDYSHSLQIIWNNALKKHNTVEDLINLVFSAMDEYRTGKSSAIFRARAVALGHLILSNKKKQTTRFVRSLVGGLQTYLRNLPTLISLFAEKYQEAALEKRNTEAIEIQKTLGQLRDSRKLLLTVGLGQLLELYVKASLQSQHSRRFPTQTWSVIEEMRQEVADLGEEWKWGEKNLIYTGIEAPSKVKDRLVKDGTYRPAVSEACARENRVRRDTNLVAEGGRIKDLFNEEGESILPLAGEVQMEVPLVWRLRRGRGRGEGEQDGRGGATRYLTEEDIVSVEDELRGLAKDIIEEWNIRLKQTPLEKAAYLAFGSEYDWGQDKVKVEMDGMRAVLSLNHLIKMKGLLEGVILRLSEVQQEKFDSNLMLEGFCSYLKYRTKEKAAGMVGDHEVYEAWYKVSMIGWIA